VEKIDIELTGIDVDPRRDGTYCIGLLVASDFSAAKLINKIEGRIIISYRRLEQSYSVLIVVDFVKDNAIIRTIDGTVAVNPKITELLYALGCKKVSCLFVGHPGAGLKSTRYGNYYPVSYLETE
jgi:hypothetical protein